MIKAEWTNKDSLDLQPTCNQLATTDGDLISRRDTIRLLVEKYKFTTKEAREILAELPSAEPNTGKWVSLEREENVYDLHGVPTWGVNYMCDKCGFITTAIQDHFAQYRWCPSCGSDMRRGGEEE